MTPATELAWPDPTDFDDDRALDAALDAIDAEDELHLAREVEVDELLVVDVRLPAQRKVLDRIRVHDGGELPWWS